MSQWIDFKELRSKLDFEQVLVHYGVEVKRKGDQHMGFCPLPAHKGTKRSPSFSANLARGIFHCFGCQAKGNILDFAVLMSGGQVDDGTALRAVAVELRDKFCGGAADDLESPKPRTRKTAETETAELGLVINAPLDFELRDLDPEHEYLRGRGFVPETAQQFGLGYCGRGSLSGRIAIPLHNLDGDLVGYAGRIVDDSIIDEENPKYRLPTKRKRGDSVLDFRKTHLVYNAHRFPACVVDVIVVEGFPSVWWLTQNGFGRVVATMGSECSDEQAEIIVSKVDPDGRIWILPDADPAGEKFAQTLLSKLSPHRFVRWVKLKDGLQPTDLKAAALKACLSM